MDLTYLTTRLEAWTDRHVPTREDRGAATVEQIVWIGVAALGAVVVAAILWAKLKGAANDIQAPVVTAP